MASAQELQVDIMEALRTLDKEANGEKYRRVLRRSRSFRRRDDAKSSGSQVQ